MNALSQDQIVSEDEFWALVESSEQKLEHIGGRVYVRGRPVDTTGQVIRAMAGGSLLHSRIIENLSASLKTELRSTGCRASGSNFHIGIETTGDKLLPDNAIHCGEPRLGHNGQSLLNPVCVFEVLSPSTQLYDQNEKFDLFARIPSLQDYLLIWTTFIKVVHYSRRDGGWLLQSFTGRTEHISLQGAPIRLSVADIYDELDVPLQLILFPHPESDQ